MPLLTSHVSNFLLTSSPEPDGKDQAKMNKDAKKRKMAEKGDEGGNEDDDGYKTDEEQWGGNRNADGTDKCANGPLPGGPTGSHSNKGLLSLLKASSSSSKKSNGSNEGPPMKQARFSIDHEHPQHHEHPTQCIRSVDASAQALSSLSGSDSAGVPAVTASSGGQTGQGLSSSSGVATSNPSSSGTPKNAKSTSNKRKASTQNATSTTTDPNKRKERNAREKERSCRIARQIDDLRTLLSRGGVIVSKGTKSSVLAEAANYINALQQQQAQWEM